MKTKKPIQSQKEANHVREYLINTAIDTLGISRDQAEKRINALLSSGEIEGLSPDSLMFQMICDKYMTTPI